MQEVNLLNNSSGRLYLLGHFSLPINFMASCLWLFLSNPSLTMTLEPSPNILHTSYPKAESGWLPQHKGWPNNR